MSSTMPDDDAGAPMSDDVRRDLEAAGRRPVPPPRAEFASLLERRLVAMASVPVPTARPARAWRWPALGLAGAISTLVLVVALIGGWGAPDRSPLALELTGSINVEVALSDGTTLVDPDGLLLPDGAVVRVGPGGFARIGDVVLSPGDVARIVDQDVRIDREPPTGVLPADPTATPAAPATPASDTASPPVRSPDPTPSPRVSPIPTTVPATDRPPTPPAVTAAPTATTTTPSPAATIEPVSRATPTPVGVVAPTLKARAVGPSEVGATWTGVAGASRYVLVASSSRTRPAPDPVYPGSEIIGTFTRPPSEPLRFRVREGIAELRLVVIVLTADGAVLTRSNVVTVLLGS